MFKLDLHTHSTLSPDGGINKDQYKRILSSGVLNFVAISDHNEVAFAQELQSELGDQIIVAEEINTISGEIIGLYLSEKVPAGLDIVETVSLIKAQNGLVYVPHPYETFRKGLSEESLQRILPEIDIVEIFNARASLRGKPRQALAFATRHNLAAASSSDSHSVKGLGTSFSLLKEKPNRNNLTQLLREAELHQKNSSFMTLFDPARNRWRNKKRV
jgi:predicted metal-dependent phosphoesterase TrpH